MILRKTIFTIISIIVLMALLFSCETFDDSKSKPRVEIDSFSTIDDSTTLVVVKVLNLGVADVDQVALYKTMYGGTTTKEMSSTVQYERKAVYEFMLYHLEHGENYNFIAVASSGSYGDRIDGESPLASYSIPVPDAPETPCGIGLNSFLYQGFFYTPIYKTISEIGTEYEMSFECNYSGPRIRMYFEEEPLNGVYNTIDFDKDSDYKTVKVCISYSMGGTMCFYPNQKVYVENNGDGNIVVSFCDLKYWYYNYDYTIEEEREVDGKILFSD